MTCFVLYEDLGMPETAAAVKAQGLAAFLSASWHQSIA